MSNGPSESTFARLAGMLPNMLRGLGRNLFRSQAEKLAANFKNPKNREIAVRNLAKKLKATNAQVNDAVAHCQRAPCVICGKFFGSCRPKPGAAQNKFCPRCTASLNAGYTAAVTLDGKRFAFFKSDRLKDMAGKVVSVKPETMDEIEKNAQRADKNGEPGGESKS